MRFLNKKYSTTYKICATTGYVRDTECSDIACYSKKDDGSIGMAISGNFILENLDMEYCKNNNIEVVRSNTNYGPYGNVLSIPQKTYSIIFPAQIGLANIKTAFNTFFSTVGTTSFSNNDILIGDKKMCGMAVTKNQIVVIGSLESPPDYIANIYSQRFLDYSNKTAPIDRIGGFNSFAKTPSTLDNFLNLIKTALSDISGIEISEIKNIDGDSETIPQEYLDKFQTEEWLNKTDYHSLMLEELLRLKEERGV